MFELGVLALDRALAPGRSAPAGSCTGSARWRRPADRRSATARRSICCPAPPQAGYADLLRAHDVGLALMYTPHPSLVPIEMASAGMLTVTNSFENKTAAAMAAISSNLITAEPRIEAIAAGLRRGRSRPPATSTAARAARGAVEPRPGTTRSTTR